MGYLETGMRVLDAASSLLSRLQELAVLGANDTNTVQDHEAINAEAEALADEFNRLMTTSAYKGKDVFVTNASSEYVSVGGRNAEMTFGIGRLDYTELYDATNTTAVSYTGGPSNGTVFNIKIKPSDGVMAVPQDITFLESGVTYEITNVSPTGGLNTNGIGEINTAAASVTADSQVVNGLTFKVTGSDLANFDSNKKFEGRALFSDAGTTFNSLQKGSHYQITNAAGLVDDTDKQVLVDNSDLTNVSQVVNGVTFTVHTSVATSGMSSGNFVGEMLTGTGALTRKIEAVQAKVNTARVQAGSQYAALESAIDYTTDLTAQYELGFNTVNDVNFSMETAHLAKNQILQQAATAMLAQANQGQQSLLQLIQG
jgi:flagellin